MSNIETQENKSTFFTRLWTSISRPHSEITEIGERRRAQLLAGLSLILALTTLIGFITTILSNPLENIDLQTLSLLGLAVFSLVSYGLSRTPYYQWGSILLSAVFSVASILDVVETQSMAGAVYFLVPVYALSSALFRLRGISVLVIFNTLISFTLPILIPTIEPSYPDVGIIMTVGVLLIIVVAFRNAIERERLAEVESVNRELGELSSSLEDRVNQAVGDLALAAEIGRRVSLVRDSASILTEAVELIRERFSLYYTQIYLTDSTGHSLILRAGTGDVGRTLIQRSHRLPVDLSSINGTAAVEQRAVIIRDTETSSTHRPNPLLPDTRSEMAIPLIAGERVVGVLDLQSSQPGALSEDNLPAFEALAGQLAITIINASLFAEIEQTRRDMESQARRWTHESWDEFLNAIDRQEYVGYNYEDATLTPLIEPLSTDPSEDALVVPIQVSGETVGTLKFQGDRPWSEDDTLLADAVTRQIAQQVENLRLLAQSEQYQNEAERALRRLTREGWREYQDSLQRDLGFIYKDYEVKTLENGIEGGEVGANYPIEINDIPIGEFNIAGVETLSEADTELIAIISERLSAHLENLRLSQQTEQALSQTEILYEIGRELNLATNEDEILSAVSNTALKVGCRQTSLMYIDQGQSGKPEWLNIVAAWSREPAPGSPVGTRFSAHQFPLMAALMAHPDKPLLIPDVARDPHIDDGLRSRWMSTGIHAMCIIPLGQAGQWLGILTLSWGESHEFSHLEETIFEALISLVTPAVQSHRLYGQIQSALSETEAMLEITSVASSSLELETTLTQVLNKVLSTTGASSGLISVFNPQTQKLEIVSHELPEPFYQKLMADGLEGTLCDLVYQRKEAVILEDLTKESPIDATGLINLGFRAYQGVPLTSKGTASGTICIFYRQAVGAEELATTLMEVVGQQIGIAIENANLFEQTQKRAAELATVSELGTTITTILDTQEMLETVVNLAKERFNLYHAHIYMVDVDEKNLVLAAGAGEVGRQMVSEGWKIPLDRETSLVAKAARQREGVIVNNVKNEPDFMKNPLLPDTASEMAVPLITGGQVLGVLDVQSDKPGYFTEEDVSIQTTLASQVAVALQNAETYARTQRQAEHEALINVISQRIQSTTNIENALQVAIRELGRALGAKRTSVQLGGWADKK